MVTLVSFQTEKKNSSFSFLINIKIKMLLFIFLKHFDIFNKTLSLFGNISNNTVTVVTMNKCVFLKYGIQHSSSTACLIFNVRTVMFYFSDVHSWS
jgi:hypothetical protein